MESGIALALCPCLCEAGADRRELSGTEGAGGGGDVEGRKKEVLDSGFRLRVYTSLESPGTKSKVSLPFMKTGSYWSMQCLFSATVAAW